MSFSRTDTHHSLNSIDLEKYKTSFPNELSFSDLKASASKQLSSSLPLINRNRNKNLNPAYKKYKLTEYPPEIKNRPKIINKIKPKKTKKGENFIHLPTPRMQSNLTYAISKRKFDIHSTFTIIEEEEDEKDTIEKDDEIKQMTKNSLSITDVNEKKDIEMDITKSRVSFNKVSIREYKSDIAPTSVPYEDGLPVGLSWDLLKEEEYDIDEYEWVKENDPKLLDAKHFQDDGILTVKERMRIVKKAGADSSYILKTIEDITTTQLQREASKSDTIE